MCVRSTVTRSKVPSRPYSVPPDYIYLYLKPQILKPTQYTASGRKLLTVRNCSPCLGPKVWLSSSFVPHFSAKCHMRNYACIVDNAAIAVTLKMGWIYILEDKDMTILQTIVYLITFYIFIFVCRICIEICCYTQSVRRTFGHFSFRLPAAHW